MKRVNPPIRGHELISEGNVTLDSSRAMLGGCRCGAKPPMNGEYLPFKNAVKNWHRNHKAQIRRERL